MDNQIIQQDFILWLNYAKAKKALLDKNYIRSHRDPEADFAEWLVAFITNGSLPENMSQEGYDVEIGDKRIEVKKLGKSYKNENGYIIKDKDKNNKNATHYAFIFYKEFMPSHLFIVAKDFVKNFKKTHITLDDLKKAWNNKKSYKHELEISNSTITDLDNIRKEVLEWLQTEPS